MNVISRILTLFGSKVNSALDRLEDPRQTLDYAYSQQKELLVKTKQGLVEVATSRVQLERECKNLRRDLPRVEDQALRALAAGREDLARIALQRKQTILNELDQLDVQIEEIGADEKRLSETEKQLAVRIEEFRTRRTAVAARYTAAKAQVRVSEALTGVSGEFAELSMALGRATEKTDRMQARAAALTLLVDSGSLAVFGHGSDYVEQELVKVTVESAIDEDMKALKSRLNDGQLPRPLAVARRDDDVT